jgi:hypothetical protein
MGDLVIEAVPVQDLFDKQRESFAKDVTKTYEWRSTALSAALASVSSMGRACVSRAL